MRKYLLLLVLFLSFTAMGQDTGTDLLAEGKTWHLASVGQPEYSGYMFFEGDTVVGGKTCRILNHYYKRNAISDGWTFTWGCLYQEDKRIYLYDEQNDNFYLYYDFGANVGDTIRWGREPCDTLVVTTVDTLFLRERKLRRVTFLNITKEWQGYMPETHDGYVGQWIESIGGERGFESVPYDSQYQLTRLLDFREGDDVICDARLFTEEAVRYNCRMLSYNPVWSYPVLYNKDSSPQLSEIVTRKEIRLLSEGGMRYTMPHVFINVRTSAVSGIEESDHEFAMYEKEGKVFIVDSHYDEYMQDIHPEIDSPYKTREGRIVYYHLLLYDFTLDVGDKYPCKGKVYVKETGSLTTRDGISRKTLLLTNGLVIVEGIGCINSPLGLIAYQNTEEGQAIDANGTLASFGYVNEGGDISSVYENGDMNPNGMMQQPHQEIFSSGTIYDAQGRQLNRTPQKGFYIKNGRKYVK